VRWNVKRDLDVFDSAAGESLDNSSKPTRYIIMVGGERKKVGHRPFSADVHSLRQLLRQYRLELSLDRGIPAHEATRRYGESQRRRHRLFRIVWPIDRLKHVGHGRHSWRSWILLSA